MKKTGWILIVLGTLSFLGAALKGDSVFGPTFLLGIGGLLIYLKKERSEESEKVQDQEEKEVESPKVIIDEKEDESKAIAPMTFEQKEATLCLIAFFAGYNDDIMTNDAAYLISCQAATFYGIENYKETLTKAMPKFRDADKLIDTVLTIKDKKSKEFLLLSCYDLTKMSGKVEAYEILYNIAREMGYNRARLNQLIKEYSSNQ